MRWLAHIFAVLLLAAFTVSTVAHAAATTEMSTRMAVADVGMGDCDGCDEEGNALVTCDQVCIQSFAALLASTAIKLVPEAVSPSQRVSRSLVGHIGLPERHPPR